MSIEYNPEQLDTNLKTNNQGTVGIFDLVAVIGIAVVVTLIFIIINMIK